MLNAIYGCSDLEPFSPISLSEGDKKNGLRFRKQVAYVGNFIKRQAGMPDRTFSIDLGTLTHWKRTFDEFEENGVDVPLPLGHTDNPEMRRGTVVGMEIAKDAKGRDSLYNIVEFSSKEAADRLSKSNVSVWVPPDFTLGEVKDGKPKTWTWPIRHLAVTDYPVIPGLAPFEAVALSFETLAAGFGDPPQPGVGAPGSQPPAPSGAGGLVQKLGAMLGVAPLPDPAQMEQAVVAKVTELVNMIKAMSAKPQVQPPAPAPALGAPRNPVAMGFVNMVQDARATKLKSLVGVKITPAAYEKLVEKYCKPEALSLSISQEGNVDDSFEDVYTALLDGPNMPMGGKTGLQLAHLPKGSSGESDNVLVRDAERRKKERKTG